MKKFTVFLIFLVTFTINCFTISMNINKTFALKDETNLNVSSKSALLIEASTGSVIYEKNADERLPIASMTKLASLAIIFDAINKGAIKEDDFVQVSETAAAVGGSSAFLDAGSKYKVLDLIKSVIVASANDSTVALAEFVSGSEEGFVLKMNALAKSLALENTNFENATGLPIANHYSSARDISKIYLQICDNKIYKKFSQIWMDDLIHPSGRKTGLVNTNRLVKTYDGIEGGKTGYTDSAKFCLTSSAKRNGMRLVSVIIGASDSKTRFAETTKLFNYGFANFSAKLVATHEIPVGEIFVKNSKNKLIAVPEKDVSVFGKKGEVDKFRTEFKFEDNLVAPIYKNQVIGKVYVLNENNIVTDECNLIAENDVFAKSFKDKFEQVIKVW